MDQGTTGRPVESNAAQVAGRLLIELPAWGLLALAAAVGVVWASSLFDWSFVSGQAAFWRFPMGTIPNSQNDTASALGAYLFYVQSPWRLPLFHVSALGGPAGTNILFADPVPVVALAGKLIHSLTGATVNLYGAYLFLCFSLPGVMMTLVLIATRTRYALAAIIGSIFADTMPALLWRWGHIALEAHYLLIGALALYLFSLNKASWRRLPAAWGVWLLLAYLTNIYLFVMVGAVWFCALIQRRLDKLTTTREMLMVGALTVAAVTIVIALGGQFGAQDSLPLSGGYGYFSMNLLSPFAPQKSAVLPALAVVDATGGQYEGFNYFGLGLLFASLLMLPDEVRWLRGNQRRHLFLLMAFAALTAFALSCRVYAGRRLLLELPLPIDVILVLGIFRSSGRFFWLIVYAQAAIVVVLAFRRKQPAIVLCLAAAALLQLFDVQLLREQIIASIAAGPGREELDPAQLSRLIAGARTVDVAPSFQCSGDADQRRANMEVMLAAARANVPTNTVNLARETYGLTLRDAPGASSKWDEMLQARKTAFCGREITQAALGGSRGDAFVLLSDQPRQRDLAPGIRCTRLSRARYCSRSQISNTPK